jgi:hypothetical protein
MLCPLAIALSENIVAKVRSLKRQVAWEHCFIRIFTYTVDCAMEKFSRISVRERINVE